MAKMTIEERLTKMEGQHDADKAVIKAQGDMLKKMKNPGIQSARPNKKPVLRPWTREEKAERELRKYIKNAGHYPNDKGKKIKPGFRRHLSDEKKDRAKVLMKILGRKELKWDEDILDFRNHQPITDLETE